MTSKKGVEIDGASRHSPTEASHHRTPKLLTREHDMPASKTLSAPIPFLAVLLVPSQAQGYPDILRTCPPHAI